MALYLLQSENMYQESTKFIFMVTLYTFLECDEDGLKTWNHKIIVQEIHTNTHTHTPITRIVFNFQSK